MFLYLRKGALQFVITTKYFIKSGTIDPTTNLKLKSPSGIYREEEMLFMLNFNF